MRLPEAYAPEVDATQESPAAAVDRPMKPEVFSGSARAALRFPPATMPELEQKKQPALQLVPHAVGHCAAAM